MSEPKPDIVRRFLTEVRSPDDFASYFTDDAQFHFGNLPAAVGRDAIRESSVRFRQRLKGVRHDIHEIWAVGDVAVCEMTVIYTRLDDTTVSVPCCDRFVFAGDRIADLRVFVDPSPVFA